MSEFNSKFIKYLCLLLFLKGCAYFNTFYNAEEHFDLAERIRIENLVYIRKDNEKMFFENLTLAPIDKALSI